MIEMKELVNTMTSRKTAQLLVKRLTSMGAAFSCWSFDLFSASQMSNAILPINFLIELLSLLTAFNFLPNGVLVLIGFRLLISQSPKKL